MSQLPDYMKNRTMEHNIVPGVYRWDEINQYSYSGCSFCCFRNWRKFCEDMPCLLDDYKGNVYWYPILLPEDDVPTLLLHFKAIGGNTKDLAEKKKTELLEFLESGKTVSEWKDKKYHDACRAMGRN